MSQRPLVVLQQRAAPVSPVHPGDEAACSA